MPQNPSPSQAARPGRVQAQRRPIPVKAQPFSPGPAKIFAFRIQPRKQAARWLRGSEWTVLEQLLASDEDQAKIRTLDMEIHFGFRAASERYKYLYKLE